MGTSSARGTQTIENCPGLVSEHRSSSKIKVRIDGVSSTIRFIVTNLGLSASLGEPDNLLETLVLRTSEIISNSSHNFTKDTKTFSLYG